MSKIEESSRKGLETRLSKNSFAIASDSRSPEFPGHVADVAEKARSFSRVPELASSWRVVVSVGYNSGAELREFRSNKQLRHTRALATFIIDENDNFIDGDEDCLDQPGRACASRE